MREQTFLCNLNYMRVEIIARDRSGVRSKFVIQSEKVVKMSNMGQIKRRSKKLVIY